MQYYMYHTRSEAADKNTKDVSQQVKSNEKEDIVSVAELAVTTPKEDRCS
jgi:hypothetical protein